jgi:YkoY family integral membrane protein
MIILTILFLAFLEGMLSFDNAIVLAVLASELPKEDQKKALTYGMWGAIGFRALALLCLTFIMQSIWVKFAGAAYLFYLAGKHFFGAEDSDDARQLHPTFWRTVLAIEMTDIAFSTDSILAAVGVSQEFWVVLVGGILGICMMRVAAAVFVHLIKIFPRLVTTAYILIAEIAVKLTIEGFGISWHDSYRQACLWMAMGLAILFGFIPLKQELKTSV